ncbi:MAG TPA: hypothetical protein VF263_04810 [Longimicrobiaceae bacterium]
MTTLSAEDLLAGSALTFEVEVPAGVLRPSADGMAEGEGRTVRLRPLTVRDLQLISRGARDNDSLVATFMVQRALVEPEMSVAEVAGMHVGLLQFLLDEVNRISGMAATPEQVAEAAQAPLAKAAFVLAREFGWTPQEVSELTLGQVLLHLQMLGEKQPA